MIKKREKKRSEIKKKTLELLERFVNKMDIFSEKKRDWIRIELIAREKKRKVISYDYGI